MLEIIRKTLHEQIGVEPETVNEETDIHLDLTLTSLDLVNLVMAIEDEFGITVSKRDAIRFDTIGDIIRFVSRQLCA